MSSDVAYLNPSVLKWAISASRLPLGLIAERIDAEPQQLEAWATDPSVHPPFSKAQRLAGVLRIPFGYLFLPKPPVDSLPLPDFRTLEHLHKPTPEFLQLLSDTMVKQDWFRDYLKASGRASRLKFVGKFGLESSVSDVATDIRQTIGATHDLRTAVGSWSEYLSTLCRHAEGAGVLVMRSSIVGNTTARPVSTREVQGFALNDALAPLVFVNSGDYKTAQIFTLVHELTHIWIGQSAIDNPDEAEPSENAVEAFCNRVAASVLVPMSEFESAWDSSRPETRLASLARRFWVSPLVVLRRAREAERISLAQFTQLREEERRKITRAKKPSGGDFYRNLVARMGARFTSTVIGEVNRNAVSVTQGARLLGVRGGTLLKLAEISR